MPLLVATANPLGPCPLNLGLSVCQASTSFCRQPREDKNERGGGATAAQGTRTTGRTGARRRGTLELLHVSSRILAPRTACPTTLSTRRGRRAPRALASPPGRSRLVDLVALESRAAPLHI